jgi:hypothetical protein
MRRDWPVATQVNWLIPGLVRVKGRTGGLFSLYISTAKRTHKGGWKKDSLS